MRALTFAVIGTPIGHSKSPAMHQRAYEARGLPHRYVKLDTSAAEVAERVQALRAGTYAGVNVTVPHKRRVLDLVDVVEPSARDVGAANTLVRDDAGKVHAFNTDALALRMEIERLSSGVGVGLVIGDGGAARAAVTALGMAHAVRVIVRARAFAEAARARAFEASFPSVPVEAVPLAAPAEEPSDLGVVIQATSCGMTGGPPADAVVAAVAWKSVPKSAAVIDVVYKPRETAFLSRARAEGLVAEDGLRMLALQGALAFQLWLGGEPPFDPMLAAVLDPGA